VPALRRTHRAARARSLKTRTPDDPQVSGHEPIHPESEHPAKIMPPNSHGHYWIRVTYIFINDMRIISSQVIDSKQSLIRIFQQFAIGACARKSPLKAKKVAEEVTVRLWRAARLERQHRLAHHDSCRLGGFPRAGHFAAEALVLHPAIE